MSRSWSEVIVPARDRFPWMSNSEQRRLGSLMRRKKFLDGLGDDASDWDRAEAKALEWALDFIESVEVCDV